MNSFIHSHSSRARRFGRAAGRGSALLFLAGLLLSLGGVGCAGTATRSSTGEVIDDSVITTRVKTALFRDPVAPGTDITVNTFRSQVQLSGFVNSQTEKDRATELARAVPGVRDVINNVVVKP